jgi:toxin ParE1/3/4
MKILYLRSALKDLQDIRTYIARENPVAAERVVARIAQAASRLENFPYSGRSGRRGSAVRLLSVTGLPYIVVHRIVGETVRIVAVFHSSRNRRY